MQETVYEQFIDEMEKNGFRKVRSVIDEIYAKLSDDDETISVAAHDCHMITIKGIRESTTRDRKVTPPHLISMKIYSDNGKELRSDDTIQFSIVELKHKGLPTMEPDVHSVVYYHYPYRAMLAGVKLKKGIAITKDKRLEIKIFRSSNRLKIGKFEMHLECDKWFKIDEKRNDKLTGLILDK